MKTLSITDVKNLPNDELLRLQKLIKVFNAHTVGNATKEKYYDGKVSLSDVNIGIALPEKMQNLRIHCEWATKAVDVLAARSMFDGFVGKNGTNNETLNKIIEDNNFIAQYNGGTKDELKFGCTFVTMSADPDKKVSIKFHSPKTAAALWSGEKSRIDCGFAIIDTVEDETKKNEYCAKHINYYTDTDIWELTKVKNVWSATRHQHKLGQPLMIPLIWGATTSKPFGRSRIKSTVRSLVDGHIRTIANATIGLEFATSPQKYLLGITDEQFDAVVDQKFQQYVGSLLVATNNPETGTTPQFGQLTQGTLQPHVEMLRMLATQFSAETGLSVTDTGVINDANPTSSDAIMAQSQTLVSLAKELNESNGVALNLIAKLSLAIAENKTLSELGEEADIIAHFKNPAMPNVAATADAAIKIASARQSFANTDVFLEMIGFDLSDIVRIKAQEQRARGLDLLSELEDDLNE